MRTIFGREPVMYLAIVKAAVVLIVAFGFELEAEQVAAVYVLAEAVLAFVARGQVTPVEDPRPSTGAVGVASGWGRSGGGSDESGARRGT